MRVSEIRVNQIRVNQGLGVVCVFGLESKVPLLLSSLDKCRLYIQLKVLKILQKVQSKYPVLD